MAHGIDLTDSLGVDVDLGDDAVDMALPEIYLKQIRSIECGTDAALQQLCDSHATIETLSFAELPTSYAMTIQAHRQPPAGCRSRDRSTRRSRSASRSRWTSARTSGVSCGMRSTRRWCSSSPEFGPTRRRAPARVKSICVAQRCLSPARPCASAIAASSSASQRRRHQPLDCRELIRVDRCDAIRCSHPRMVSAGAVVASVAVGGSAACIIQPIASRGSRHRQLADRLDRAGHRLRLRGCPSRFETDRVDASPWPPGMQLRTCRNRSR